MNLQAVLAKSKQVMERTKNLPYGGYNEQSGTVVNNKNGDVMFEQRIRTNDNSPVFSEEAASKSKLPKEIINAIRESSTSTTSSVTDSINLTKPQRNPYDIITEEKTIQPQVATNTNVGIDYSLIRMMIDESIKKYTSQLKKTILNESKGTNSGLQMMTKQGNKFRFVTEDGKIFEANLVYKGNLNDK